MTQNEFFNILMDGLKDFPEAKLQEIISYYQNNFSLELSAGKTEEEIISELGNPNLIVNKYRNEYLDIPVNSESFSDDSSVDSNVDKYFSTNNIIYTKDKNMVTSNKSNDLYSDFKSNDGFNEVSSNSSKNFFKTDNNKLNDFKVSDSYEGINSNDNFYNLETLDSLRDNLESNYNSIDQSNSNYNSNSSNYSFNNSNFNNKQNSNNADNRISRFNVNTILKICIVILSLIIFFPIITGIIGCIIGLLGVAISILVASIGVLVGGTFTSFIGLPNVPAFVANFPYPVIVLFSLGSISLSILLILLFYYLCKFFVRISIKIYHSLKSEGGAF